MNFPCPTCGGSDCICTFASKLAELQAELATAHAAGFAEGVDASAKVCDGYGREGDMLGKEYAAETADELAARCRALIPAAKGGAK